MKNRDPIAYLEDILFHADKVAEFIAGFDQARFEADDRTVFAVIRCFEVIGEAANRISRETQARFPDIPWPQVIGFRNLLIHEYLGVKRDRLWVSAERQLPETMPAFRRMMDTLLAEEVDAK